MPDIPWDDFFVRPPGQPRPPLAPIVEQLLGAYCEYTSDNPEILTSVGRQLRDHWCPPPAPPRRPTEPPTFGGQCCELYDVTWSLRTSDGSPGASGVERSVPGRIRVRQVDTPNPNDDRFYDRNIFIETGLDCGGSADRIGLGGGTNLSADFFVALAGYSIVRSDGSLDACGQFVAPPIIPDVLPPLQPPPIVINVDGVDITVPIVIPIINLPIDVNVRPEFNIQLPDINFNFTFDGINISFPSGGSPENPPTSPPIPPDRLPPGTPTSPPRAPSPPGGGDGGGDGNGNGGDGSDCPDVNLAPVLRAIENVQEDVDESLIKLDLLLDCDRCDRPAPEDCRKQFIGSAQGAKFSLPSGAEWVGIEVTSKPENWKGYFAENSPDVVFAGWHSFGSSAAEGVRTPVQYDDNIYPVVEGASSFSFGLQTGYVASYFIYFGEEQTGVLD